MSGAEARPAAPPRPTTLVDASPDVTLYAYRIGLAARGLETGNSAGAETILEECSERLRNWEWRHLRNLCRPAFRIPAEGREVESVAFSPDGARLAIASSKVKIVDPRDGRTLAEAPQRGTCLAYSEDGRKLALAGFKELVILDPDTAKVILTIPAHDYLISCVAFSPDGRRLVSGSGTPAMGPPSSGEMKVWD